MELNQCHWEVVDDLGLHWKQKPTKNKWIEYQVNLSLCCAWIPKDLFEMNNPKGKSWSIKRCSFMDLPQWIGIHIMEWYLRHNDVHHCLWDSLTGSSIFQDAKTHKDTTDQQEHFSKVCIYISNGVIGSLKQLILCTVEYSPVQALVDTWSKSLTKKLSRRAVKIYSRKSHSLWNIQINSSVKLKQPKVRVIRN